MNRDELLTKMRELWDGFDVDDIPEEFHSDRERSSL